MRHAGLAKRGLKVSDGTAQLFARINADLAFDLPVGIKVVPELNRDDLVPVMGGVQSKVPLQGLIGLDPLPAAPVARPSHPLTSQLWKPVRPSRNEQRASRAGSGL